MRVKKLIAGSASVLMLLGLGPSGSAGQEGSGHATIDESAAVTPAQEQGAAASKSPGAEATKPERVQSKAPLYKPPRSGRAWRTIGGATRGFETCRPDIAVLAPHDHSGLTTREQPVLFWFLSEACPASVEFTLMEADGIHPVVELRLAPPTRAGVQAVHLADHGVRLEVGTLYAWSIALVPDPDHRSKDAVAQAGILRIEVDPNVSTQLARAREGEAPLIYAEAGLWYDALAELSALIEADPSNDAPRRQRAALLEQVQLTEIAAHETSVALPNPG